MDRLYTAVATSKTYLGIMAKGNDPMFKCPLLTSAPRINFPEGTTRAPKADGRAVPDPVVVSS